MFKRNKNWVENCYTYKKLTKMYKVMSKGFKSFETKTIG